MTEDGLPDVQRGVYQVRIEVTRIEDPKPPAAQKLTMMIQVVRDCQVSELYDQLAGSLTAHAEHVRAGEEMWADPAVMARVLARLEEEDEEDSDDGEL